MKHKHAELMMEYAKDAMETAEPWERWEYYSHKCKWEPFKISGPSWDEESEYRRKARTININGHEVPEPYRGEMSEGQIYYIPLLGLGSKFMRASGCRKDHDQNHITAGLVHLNKEAAMAHAEALESLTKM